MSVDGGKARSAAPCSEASTLALLSETRRLFCEATELHSLLDSALRKLSAALGCDSATVYLLLEGRLVVQQHYEGLLVTRTGREPLTRELAVDADSAAGRCVLARQPVFLRVDQWPLRTRALALEIGARHGAALPLMMRGRPIGSLCLLRVDDTPFSAEERERLELCAAQLALGLNHLRLFDAQRRQMEDLRVILDVGQAITRSHICRRSSSARCTAWPVSPTRPRPTWLIDPKTGLMQGARCSSEAHLELSGARRSPSTSSRWRAWRCAAARRSRCTTRPCTSPW